MVKKVNKYILQISQNNERALEKLFELTKEAMWYVALKYLADRSKIEDVLNVAYLNVYNNSNKFDSSQNGVNWLYSIVKNVALNQNREDKKNEIFINNGLEIEEEEFQEQDLMLQLLVKDAIGILDEKEKTIVKLKFWNQLTFQQIAKQMGMPTSSVHYTYKIALKKIKNWWLAL